jgi:FkbM family methyltransferase
MSNNHTEILRRLYQYIPANTLLYRLARRYVENCDGEHNCDILTNGESRLMQTYIANVRPMVIFDVGANVGQWSDLAIRFNPMAEIHCFEPNPTTFAQLAGQHFPDNVHLNNFGLGNIARSATLQVYGELAGTNSLYRQPSHKAIRTERVTLAVLSDYCAQRNIDYIDFLKIDVEGAEFEVLKGADQLLSAARIGVVQFEYGEGYIGAKVFLKDVLEFIEAYPYNVYKLLPRKLLPVERYEIRLENFQNANYVLISHAVNGSNHVADEGRLSLNKRRGATDHKGRS